MIIILQPLTNVNWFFEVFFVIIFRVGDGGWDDESIV